MPSGRGSSDACLKGGIFETFQWLVGPTRQSKGRALPWEPRPGHWARILFAGLYGPDTSKQRHQGHKDKPEPLNSLPWGTWKGRKLDVAHISPCFGPIKKSGLVDYRKYPVGPVHPPSPPTGMQQCEEKVRFSHKCSILLLCLPKPCRDHLMAGSSMWSG